jgi:glycosyltransferase 2 family protein
MVAEDSEKGRSSRRIFAVARLIVGTALLAVLFYWGDINLNVIAPLAYQTGKTAAAAALVFLTLPLSAWRWSILLRTLGAPLPFVPLFHIQCIATVTNQFLLGPASADTVRGIYAWRALRGRTTAVAASIVADRLRGPMGLICLVGTVIALQWTRLHDTVIFSVLLLPLAIGCAVIIGGCAVLLCAPSAIRWLCSRTIRYRGLARMLDLVHGSLVTLQARPFALLAALILAYLGQCLSIAAFVMLTMAIPMGLLTTVDFATAAALALLVNAAPLVAGGLGVGEAAFDQLCRWLEPVASGSPYASLFFAYRAVSTLVFLIGFVSFVVYRAGDVESPASDALLRESGK